MNYTELIAKFWDANEKSPLGASAIALYLFLLEEYRKSEGKDFSVSDNHISQKLSLTRPTINAIKSKLRNIGLIQYQSKNGLPSIYRIVSDFSFLQQEPKKETPKVVVAPSTSETEKKEKEAPKPQETKSISEESLISAPPIIGEIEVPTLDEFMTYAKSIEIYDESMDFQLKAKYQSWIDNGWKNGLGYPITKWQNNLNNTIPHLKKGKPNNISIKKVPKISRPNITYDE